MKNQYKFKGKAYDKWVEGDLYHDYENTYIREYYTEEGIRVSTKTWHDWVVNPDTVQLLNPPKTLTDRVIETVASWSLPVIGGLLFVWILYEVLSFLN